MDSYLDLAAGGDHFPIQAYQNAFDKAITSLSSGDIKVEQEWEGSLRFKVFVLPKPDQTAEEAERHKEPYQVVLGEGGLLEGAICTCPAFTSGNPKIATCYHRVAASLVYHAQMLEGEQAALLLAPATAPASVLTALPKDASVPPGCYHKGCQKAAETDGLCADHALELALNRADLVGE